MKARIGLVAVSIVLACLASTGSAGLINVQIYGLQDASDPSVNYTGTGAAGGGGWNAYVVDATGGVGDPPLSGRLLSSTGDTTGVRFDLGSCTVGEIGTGVWTSGNALMDHYAIVESNNATVPQNTPFTLTGLTPGGSYDIYLYGLAGGIPSHYNPTAWQIGSTLKYLYNDDSFFYVGGQYVTPQPFAENRDYVLFSGIVANGGTITGIFCTLGNPSSLFNGLQVVGTFPAPEPSSIVLLSCGLLSLLAYAWRKRKA